MKKHWAAIVGMAAGLSAVIVIQQRTIRSLAATVQAARSAEEVEDHPPGASALLAAVTPQIIAPMLSRNAKRRSCQWKYIVLHHSASNDSTIGGIADWHVRGLGWKAMGYHFVIDRIGLIHVGERWRMQWEGAHCKGPRNQDGIGVCLIGNFDESPPPDAQERAAAALVDFLKTRLEIEDQNIVDHRDYAATRCPGTHFAAVQLRKPE